MHVKYLHTHTFLCVYVPKNRTHVLYITTCHKNAVYELDGYGASGVTEEERKTQLIRVKYRIVLIQIILQ